MTFQQLQMQCQNLTKDIHHVYEDQMLLQNNITNSMTSFEEKAGASQGLQGLFSGNQALRGEIMQKRIFTEQAVLKLRQQTSQLLQALKQIEQQVQQLDKTIPQELGYDLETLREFGQGIVKGFDGSDTLAGDKELGGNFQEEEETPEEEQGEGKEDGNGKKEEVAEKYVWQSSGVQSTDSA